MPTVCSICHHEFSEPESTQPESLLMGVTSKSKEIWQHWGVVYIRYPVSDLTPHPPPPLPVPHSWCFCECSLCLFICFLCLHVGRAAPVFTLPVFQSRTQMFSSVFNFTVSHINPNKHKHKSLFSPTLSSSDWLLQWCRLTWTGCFYRWLIPPTLTFVVHVRCLLRC